MVAHPFTWLLALTGTALIGQYVVKPRLPVYTMQLTSLPSLKWVFGSLQTQIKINVSLHNDNFVSIHVHALCFDFFLPDWEGALTHLGTVQDHELATTQRLAQEASWHIYGRSNFTKQDTMYVRTFLSAPIVTRTVPRLLDSWWQGRGRLVIPIAGVAYVKVNAQTRMTVSLICDNLVNTWTMTIHGLNCVMKQLQPGWANIDVAVASLREYATTELRANATGGVTMTSTTPPSKNSWKNGLVRSIAVGEELAS